MEDDARCGECRAVLMPGAPCCTICWTPLPDPAPGSVPATVPAEWTPPRRTVEWELPSSPAALAVGDGTNPVVVAVIAAVVALLLTIVWVG